MGAWIERWPIDIHAYIDIHSKLRGYVVCTCQKTLTSPIDSISREYSTLGMDGWMDDRRSLSPGEKRRGF